MAKWFCLVDGKQVGPLAPAELKRLAESGRLKPTDKVRRDDIADWHAAREVKGLFAAAPSKIGAAGSPAVATAPRPVAPSAAPRAAGNGVAPSAPPGAAPASAQPVGDSPPTNGQAEPTSQSDWMHGRFSSVLTDLRALNFWEEIAPIDSTNIGRMVTDPVTLAVIGAAISPLVIITLQPSLQMAAFAMLFAFAWGMVFKHYIVRSKVSWFYLLGSLCFTGFVGMPLLLAMYRFVLPGIYLNMPASENIVVSLVGFVLQVGVWEEACKILPVLLYLIWKRRRADPKASLMIGVFSGLGFAAFENLHYANLAIVTAAGLVKEHGESGLYQGVEGAMINVLVRSLSLVFCHALFTGIFSYFLTMAFLTGRRYIALAITGLAVSAIIHGLYDWLAGQQQTFAAMVMAASFVLFYAYLLKLKALAGDGPTLQPTAPPPAAPAS